MPACTLQIHQRHKYKKNTALKIASQVPILHHNVLCRVSLKSVRSLFIGDTSCTSQPYSRLRLQKICISLSLPKKSLFTLSYVVETHCPRSCYVYVYCQGSDPTSAEKDWHCRRGERSFVAPYEFMSPGLLYSARFNFASKKSVKCFLADVGKENVSFWTWLPLHDSRVLITANALQILLLIRVISVYLLVISITKPSWQA